MGSILKFTPRPTTDKYFGGCPHCGQNDGFVNVESEQWFSCARHKTKWRVGSNLFSGWRDEDEATWQRNRFKLAEYMTVEPVYPRRSSMTASDNRPVMLHEI